MHKLLLAGATAAVLSFAGSAMALCPSPLPTPAKTCETGTVKYIGSNEVGYKVKIAESGNIYAVQYTLTSSDAEANGLIKGLGDGTARSILSDGRTNGLANDTALNIVIVRNADQ